MKHGFKILAAFLVAAVLLPSVLAGCTQTESNSKSENTSLESQGGLVSNGGNTESGNASDNTPSDNSTDNSLSGTTSDNTDDTSEEISDENSKDNSNESSDGKDDNSNDNSDDNSNDNSNDNPNDKPNNGDTVPDCGADALRGYENLNLTYTFRYHSGNKGRHSESDFMPYVAYLDKNGNIKDYFFDSYLFLPCVGAGPSGASMHANLSNPTKAVDWTAYVDDTFAPYANVNALETAFGKANSALGGNKKAGVFFTILYPNSSATSFGTLGGKSLNFANTSDRKYAIKWIIDEQIKRFNDAGYKNLDLVGFYWLEEYLINEYDVDLLQYASQYLHSKGLKFIWIPWYRADGYNRVDELGFDAVCMQPNLFWLGYTDPNRVNESVKISKQYGMGMEIELDFSVSQEYFFNRYLYYLEGGMNGGMMDRIKMYYQDTGPGVYYSACYSDQGIFRAVYDLTYKYAKKTLTQNDINYYRPQGMDDNYVADVNFAEVLNKAKWVSIGKKYTGCQSYVDGNGMPYQDVSGNELTDGIIASYDLSTDWFAFYNTIRDSEGRFSITVDLGEVVHGIKHFAAHFDNKQLYAIGTPLDIKIYTSTDGVNFKYYGSPELLLDPSYSRFYLTDDAVSARYVKLSIGDTDKLFIFCSEFLVGVDK